MTNCQNSVLRVLRNVSAWKQCSSRFRTIIGPVVSCQLHSGNVMCEKSIVDKMNQAPYPFMSSLKGDIESKEETSEFDDEWKYQSFVIFGSLSAYLIYFMFLRKEREVDQAIANVLYKGLPALEVYDLRQAIKKGKAAGKDISELEERLKVVLTPPQNKNL